MEIIDRNSICEYMLVFLLLDRGVYRNDTKIEFELISKIWVHIIDYYH